MESRLGHWTSSRISTEERLKTLVQDCGSKFLPKGSDYHCRYLSSVSGSNNDVHFMEFRNETTYMKICIRVPIKALRDDWTEVDAARLAFDAVTIGCVTDQTSMPMPKVLMFDETSINAISAPYMITSFVSGSSALSSWIKTDGPIPLETRRQNILRTTAEAMSKLRTASYNGAYILGYTSTVDYFTSRLDDMMAKNGFLREDEARLKGVYMIMRLLVENMPG